MALLKRVDMPNTKKRLVCTNCGFEFEVFSYDCIGRVEQGEEGLPHLRYHCQCPRCFSDAGAVEMEK